MPPTSVKLVNIIPQSMSHETNNDSEPNLTVNPSNPQLMAASAFTPVQQGAAPIFVSQDGGNTWVLSTVIPSDRITTDITLRFSGNGDTLYAGILPRPFTHTDPLGHAISSLNILRTKTPLGPAKMQVLVDRTGTQGVDQPYVEASSFQSGGTKRDIVLVGDNDANHPDGRTATIDVSTNAAATQHRFHAVRVDNRPPVDGFDAPSIRLAIHPEGILYGAFLNQVGGTNVSDLTYDVVVVRDDHRAGSANSFRDLLDPDDNVPGRRVVRNRVIPFLPPRGQPGPLGQERIGSHLTIAVDPRAGKSATVYLAWADRVGIKDYTIHLLRSQDSGRTWSPNDLLTITNAVNPALAINSERLRRAWPWLLGPRRITSAAFIRPARAARLALPRPWRVCGAWRRRP